MVEPTVYTEALTSNGDYSDPSIYAQNDEFDPLWDKDVELLCKMKSTEFDTLDDEIEPF